MKTIHASFIMKPLAWYLALALFIIGSIPAQSFAYLVESGPSAYSREADIQKIQRALESKIVSQRLSELGFSADEINTRLNRLSDEDMHWFASELDSLMPGGDEFLILLLLVALAVLLYLYMTGKKVVLQ